MERLNSKVFLLVFTFDLISNVQLVTPQHINSTRVAYSEEAEAVALVKFRRGISEAYLYEDYMKTDTYLIRWLRDQGLDVERAKEKLINSHKWRKQNRVDSILKEDFSDIIKQCPFDLGGRDKKGLPILTAALGQCHLRRIALNGKMEKLNRAIIFLLESVSQIGREIEKPGKNSPVQWTIIADMSGLSYREHTCLTCLPFFLNLIQVYLSNYPELLKDVYVINLTRLATTFINTLRPLAPPTHQESLYAFGFDKKEWQLEFLKRIDPDQLSTQFGGTRSFEIYG